MQPSWNARLTATGLLAQGGRRVRWLIGLLLVISFVLTDAAVVAWYASILSLGEILAFGLSLGLISAGLIVTVWRFNR
jgi:hypothetical protein